MNRRISRLIIGLLALMTAVSGVLQAPSANATSADGSKFMQATSAARASTASFVLGTKYRGGPGHETTVYAGIWSLDGKRGPCIDFGFITPDSAAGNRVITQVPGMTAEESKQAFVLVQKYRNTGSKKSATALGLATWSLRGDSGFRTWYGWAKKNGVVPAAMVARVNAMLNESKSHAPYKMRLDLTPVFDGQKGTGAVSVLDSAGKPARGLSVKVTRTTTAAKLLGNVPSTNKNGVTKFTFQRLNGRKVGFKASVTVPSVKRAVLSQPSAGRQRLLVGGFNDNFVATNEYDSSVGKPTISTVCDTDCDGQATLTVSYKNPKKSSPVRYMLHTGGSLVVQLDVKPGTTGTKSVRVTDGQIIKVSYCPIKKGKCATKPVKDRDYEVVCPAWAAAELTIPCSCDPRAQGSVTFTSPAGSPRYYRGFATIGGGTVQFDVDLVNGVPQTFSIGRVSAGTTIVVSFRAYRNADHTGQLLDETLQSVTVNGAA